ncbi:MAG: hypothetical protein ACI4QE_05420 [Acutalibacteraceae bacterium]
MGAQTIQITPKEKSTEQGADRSISQVISTLSDSSSENNSAPQSVDNGNGITLTRTPFNNFGLEEFPVKLNDGDWLWTDAKE